MIGRGRLKLVGLAFLFGVVARLFNDVGHGGERVKKGRSLDFVSFKYVLYAVPHTFRAPHQIEIDRD